MNSPTLLTRRTALAGAAVLSSFLCGNDLSGQRMRIGSSNPTGMTGGLAFSEVLFAAGDTMHGVELWNHDGAGTGRLIDIYPGPTSGYPTEITRRSPTNGNTWFVARGVDGTGVSIGRELHYYPSLPSSLAGGFHVDIRAGAAGSHPADLVVAGTTLFFTADDGVHGRELWVSDGTVAGTVMLKDIVPGANGSSPFGLYRFGTKVLFAATTPSAGTELWTSDGTAAGTVMVLDIRGGTTSSTPGDFELFQGRVYFAASTGGAATGRELWKTNGTAAGTVLVADLATGGASSAPSQLTRGAAGLAFTAHTASSGRQLYIYDGVGMVQKSTLAAGASIREITDAAGSFWFRAKTPAQGHELWRTTASGVMPVHDLQGGAGSSFPSNMVSFGSGVIFRADNGATGMEYWQTDGAVATQVQDIRVGPCSSRPSRLVPVTIGGKPRYVFAAKGVGNGIEFYATTGTTTGLVQDIDPLGVLPEMHWGSSPAAITLDIKDAAPGRPGILILGTSVFRPNLALPFVRGLVAVNLAGPTVELNFQANTLGEARFSFPPIQPTNQTSIVAQAVVLTSAAFVEISTPGSCNQGSLDLNPPSGPKVEGRICLDDESGEYTLCADRVDGLAGQEAYLGLYQKAPGGDLQLIKCYPIEAGSVIEDAGQIEILLPLDGTDDAGRHLEMHLFVEPPTPDTATPGSLVTTSYC